LCGIIVWIESLYETEQTVLKMENNLIRQMAQDQGVTEQLKAQDQMTWVRRMNNIRQAAREIVIPLDATSAAFTAIGIWAL